MSRRVRWSAELRSPAARLARVLALAALSAAAAGCEADEPDPLDTGQLAGTAVCVSCHQEQASFVGTAHHLTSTFPSGETVRGVFTGDESVLRTSNPYLHYRMDSTSSGMFQTAVIGSPPSATVRSERIDIVIGSGRKGQTHVSWRDGDRLYQLPVSYWTDPGRWVNSPAYRDGVANFERQIPPRCLECHASYFEALPDPAAVNRYDTTTFTLGISCERCHGPGKEHVERRQSPLRHLLGEAIVNPARLPRERQIEVCAQCHGGIGESITPPFSYVPDQPLENHLRLQEPPPGADIDVHGNQVALLARSACFQESAMTCSTCHDLHATERDASAFSATCLSCHQLQQCGRFPVEGHAIASRCTECHMPELRSNTVVSTFEGTTVRPRVRTHWIKVYGIVNGEE